MTFQIGNTLGGRPKEKPYRDALRAQIAAAGEDSRRLRRIAEAHLKRCEGGDMTAISMLADRLDGKVPQGIDVSEESAMQMRLEWLAWVSQMRAQAVAPSLPQLEHQAEKPNDINGNELVSKQSGA